MKKRYNLYPLAKQSKSVDDWVNYRSYRNRIVALIRETKSEYNESRLAENKNKQRGLREISKQLGKGQSKNNIDKVTFEDVQYKNEQQIAENSINTT